MSYEIIIKRTTTVRKTVEGRWCQVGEKEVARDRDFITSENDPKTRIEAVYGYPTTREENVTETTEILKQVVDELDLPAVIRAINGLDGKQ